MISIYLSICLSVYLSIYLSILSIYLSVYLIKEYREAVTVESEMLSKVEAIDGSPEGNDIIIIIIILITT